MRGIEAQFLALQKGFTELIPQHLLKPFDHKELEVHAARYINKQVTLMTEINTCGILIHGAIGNFFFSEFWSSNETLSSPCLQ